MAGNTKNAGPNFGRFSSAIAEEKPAGGGKIDADLVALLRHSGETDTGYTLPVAELATGEPTQDLNYAKATRTLYAAAQTIPGKTVQVRAKDSKKSVWFKTVSKKAAKVSS